MPPPAIPPSIPALLSQLRSGIFQTLHNPTHARTGAKYLRRRLVGPSMIQYYPKMPSLKRLNAVSPYNRFANWQGAQVEVFKADAIAEGSSGQREKWGNEASEGGKVEGEAAETGVGWLNRGQMLSAREAVPEGWTEVTRVAGAGWLDDELERVRGREVEERRLAGKGPPKKGQGRRSQMKKR